MMQFVVCPNVGSRWSTVDRHLSDGGFVRCAASYMPPVWVLIHSLAVIYIYIYIYYIPGKNNVAMTSNRTRYVGTSFACHRN